MKRLLAFVLSLAVAAFASLSLAVPAAAQGGGAVTQQELAQRKFAELNESMKTLHAYLAKAGDQDDLKVLRAGMTLVQERRIEEEMGRVRSLLDAEKWDGALALMQTVRTDLVQLLEVLQNRNTDLQKLLEQIARLQDLRGEVDKLAKEQGTEKEDSARTEELQKQLEEIAAARAAAERLLAEQKQLRDSTNALGLAAAAAATEPLAQKEGELAEGTEKLADRLENIESRADKLAAKSEQPGANKPGEQKPGEQKPAEGKPGEGKPGESAKSPGKGGGCCSSAKGAASAMKQAQGQLGAKKPESSLRDQDQAIEKLGKTLEQLDELAEQARRELDKLPFDQQARRQEDTQHATDTLAKKMEQAEQDGENGEGQPTPGRKSVQQAVPKQKAAAGSLKEYRPAKQKQQDAKEDLEKARDELDEAINQLRQQLVDEVLRSLEERFTAMLAKQRELSAQTKTLDKTRGTIVTADGSVPAALADKIQTVGAGEQDLEVEAQDAHKLLEEDGTVAVFPELVAEMAATLKDVARRCRANETGKAVQTGQADVEEMLTYLINALRRIIEQREGGQAGQCNGQPPLVPMSAELKVLKYLQERVNKATKEYDDGTPPALRDTDEARTEARDLATREARVQTLMRKLAVKQNKENHAEEGK